MEVRRGHFLSDKKFLKLSESNENLRLQSIITRENIGQDMQIYSME